MPIKYRISIRKEEGGTIPMSGNDTISLGNHASSEILSMEVEEINLQRIITAIIGSRKRKSKA